MAGSKNCYSACSKSRGTKASKRSLVKRGKKSASWPVRPDITVDNRTFFETTLAVCEKNVAFKQAVINAFVETIDFSGPRTRFHIQPWADGYESSSSSEDDEPDEQLLRLLSPGAMEERIEQMMKEEAARKARERERVGGGWARNSAHYPYIPPKSQY